MAFSFPLSNSFLINYTIGHEFINNVDRYCLWLTDISPSDIRKMPLVMERVSKVRDVRASSKRQATNLLASRPTLFAEIRQPNGSYIAFPKVSSERRKYVPIGILPSEVIAGDKLFVVPNSTIYHFGILTSGIHMAWLRAVGGRLKSDYSYSNTISIIISLGLNPLIFKGLQSKRQLRQS